MLPGQLFQRGGVGGVSCLGLFGRPQPQLFKENLPELPGGVEIEGAGELIDVCLNFPDAAAKLLAECGYEDLSGADAAGIDAALTKHRNEIFAELAGMAPQPEVVDIFRLKYDYHNIKTLVKAAGANVSGDRLLSGSGRVAPEKLKAAVEEDSLSSLPADMARAYEEARSVLARTGNPQLADFGLDAAYFAELLRLAEATGSDFIKGYVRTMIDSANLRAAVRTVRMGKDRDFMLTALVPGGFADRDILAAAAESGDGLAAVFASTCLEKASRRRPSAQRP